MIFARSKPSFAAWFIPLLVLLALAALMSLNPGGITSGLGGLQHDWFAGAQPGAAAGTTNGALAAIGLGHIDPGAWASNAASLWPQLLFLAVAGAALVVLLSQGRMVWAGIFTVVAIAAALGVSYLLLARAQLFEDMLTPSLVLALAFLSGGLLRPRRRPSTPVNRSRAYAEAASVPPPELAARAPAPPPGKAEARTITYLVSRLRSDVNPALEPGATLALMHGVAAPMTEAVSVQRGTPAYAAGDRFAASWNAPLEDADHAVHACEAALRMAFALTQTKDQHGEGSAFNSLEVGIGIATGAAIAGTAEGSGTYTVFGECADVADRLSRLSERYGPAILVSEATRDAAERNFAFLEVDCIADAEDRPLKIYALLGNPLVRASPKFRALSTFHEHLFQAIRAQRWTDARTLIDQCRNLSGAIPKLYDLHLARIEWYEDHPPPADWDGAFRPPLV